MWYSTSIMAKTSPEVLDVRGHTYLSKELVLDLKADRSLETMVSVLLNYDSDRIMVNGGIWIKRQNLETGVKQLATSQEVRDMVRASMIRFPLLTQRGDFLQVTTDELPPFFLSRLNLAMPASAGSEHATVLLPRIFIPIQADDEAIVYDLIKQEAHHDGRQELALLEADKEAGRDTMNLPASVREARHLRHMMFERGLISAELQELAVSLIVTPEGKARLF